MLVVESVEVVSQEVLKGVCATRGGENTGEGCDRFRLILARFVFPAWFFSSDRLPKRAIMKKNCVSTSPNPKHISYHSVVMNKDPADVGNLPAAD